MADEGLRPAVDESRRGWLHAAAAWLFGLGMTACGSVAALWTAGTARFMMPNVMTEPPHRFKVGFPADYPPGHVETRYKDTYGVWVIHGKYRSEAQIYALRTACTHLGCITLWQANEQRFKCPCHGSGFYRDGLPFEGPAPRALERCAIRLADDGQIEIDTNQIFREELGQWADPASFLPA